jgi:tRNA threonylcarbamoyladenosine biosynthesis protein TsaB
MALILNIDTAIEIASVCIAEGERIVASAVNRNQKDHAAWVQTAVQQIMYDAGRNIQDLQAVAVTEGPGSYTGLRVGMATAKGICYALQIPLITESTLRVMAHAAKGEWVVRNPSDIAGIRFCPMIDARRMEVFTAIYDMDLVEVMPARALILDENSFKEALKESKIVFFGSGSDKWKPVHFNASLLLLQADIQGATSLAKLAAARFSKEMTSDLAYADPVYLKEFYSYIKK